MYQSKAKLYRSFWPVNTYHAQIIREKIIVTVSHVKTCRQGRLYMYHFLPHAVKMSNIFWERKVLINDAPFIIVFLAWAGKKMLIKHILWNEKGSVFRTQATPKLIDCLKKSSKSSFYYHVAYLTLCHIILLRFRSNTLFVPFWSCLELQSFQQTKEIKKTFNTALMFI